jgi:hypothetical protein
MHQNSKRTKRWFILADNELVHFATQRKSKDWLDGDKRANGKKSKWRRASSKNSDAGSNDLMLLGAEAKLNVFQSKNEKESPIFQVICFTVLVISQNQLGAKLTAYILTLDS